MSRVTIKYPCGCEIHPFVAVEEGEMALPDDREAYSLHEFDVEVYICDRHKEEAIEAYRRGETTDVTPFDNMIRRFENGELG